MNVAPKEVSAASAWTLAVCLFLLVGAAWSPSAAAQDRVVNDGTLDATPAACTTAPDDLSINAAITNATAGNTILVCPGTYAENVVVNQSLTIQGANAGTPGNGSRTAESVVVPGTQDLATGQVFSIQASGVTLDGLTIDGNNTGIAGAYDAVQGVGIDASATLYDNITVTNSIFQNFPNSSTLGPAVPAGGVIAQASAGGASTGNTFSANLLQNFEGYVDGPPEEASVGIGIANNFGASITGNVINDVAFGILMFGIDPGVATATVTGGDISNVRRGIVIYPGAQPGGYTIDGTTITSAEEFGIVSFRFDGAVIGQPQLGDGSQPVTTTIQNVTVTQTESPSGSGDAAGIATNAFNTGGGAYTTTISNSTVRDNFLRGINVRGGDDQTVSVTVNASVIEGNGYNPLVAGNANGVIAQRGGELVVNNSIISNGSASQSASDADAVSSKAESGGMNAWNGFVTVNNSQILAPVGQAVVYVNPGSGGDPGRMDVSGNWHGSADPATFSTNFGGPRAADIDYSPFLRTGTDTDAGTAGFQSDVTTLGVDSGSNQVQTASRFTEAATLGGSSAVFAYGTSGSYDVESGGAALNGDLVVVDNLTFASGSGPLAVPEEIRVQAGVTSISSTQSFTSQNITTGTAGTGNDTGWRMLASPRAGATGADVLDDLNASTSDGSVLYRYNDVNQTFIAVSSGGTALPSGEGFFLYLFDDATEPVEPSSPLTLDITGSVDPNTGAFSSGTDFSIGDRSVGLAAVGFDNEHFLGNPYAQSFDLSNLLVDGTPLASNTEVQAVAQIWDVTAGTDGEFVPVTEDPGSSDLLAPWQGFYIERASGTSGSALTATFSSAGRSSGAPFIPAKSGPTPNVGRIALDLALTGPGGDVRSDSRLHVYLRDGASVGTDAFDARRHAPWTESYAQLSVVSSDGYRKIQESLPYDLLDAVDVPLHVEAIGTSGTATITLPTWENVPEDWGLTLTDNALGERMELAPGDTYTFALDETAASNGLAATTGMPEMDGAPRFTLTAGPAAPLPVELVDFRGVPDGEGGVLTWRTLSETNNEGFVVEQKREGTFRRVGFVEGAGTTSDVTTYRFPVEELSYGTHTFRLRQVDLDGTESLSNTTTVERVLTEAVAVEGVAPNPVTESSRMIVTVRETEDVRIEAYDALGRRVALLYDGTMAPGREHTISLDALPGASGHYFLRITGESFSRVERAVVLR